VAIVVASGLVAVATEVMVEAMVEAMEEAAVEAMGEEAWRWRRAWWALIRDEPLSKAFRSPVFAFATR
jgi:hypothetical protein